MKENGNALLWVLLVLFPPIGIIYMWVKKKDFPQKKKSYCPLFLQFGRSF